MAIRSTVLVTCDTLAEISQVEQSAPIVFCVETESFRFKNGTWKDAVAKGLKEASGTALAIASVADGQYLRRSGASLIGATPAGGGGDVLAYKTSDQTNIGTSFADVTGVGLSVLANKAYAFEFILLCDADAATTGIDVSCNGPASPSGITYEVVYWTSATARTERCFTAYNGDTASTASNGTAVKAYRVRGVLRNGANAGTLIARAKREAVGTGPNVRAGSYGRLTALD